MKNGKPGGGLALWGLVSAIVMMAATLFVTLWMTRSSVEDASSVLMRGQADAFADGVRFRLHFLRRLPTSTDLAELVSDFEEEGLRYLAIARRDGLIVAEAGEPVGRTVPPGAARAMPVVVGDRVRVATRVRAGGPRRGFPPRVGMVIIEFVPRRSAELEASANRALVVGGVAAGVLLLVAVGVVRWYMREAALARQLEHKRRLASLGEMSAVLSHEIRNPLASLKGNAQLLERDLPEESAARTKAQRVVREAIRLETLTSDLLEFVRTGELRVEDTDPAALLDEVVASLESERIEAESRSAPRNWAFDRDRMRQVLTNLLTNALAASDRTVDASVRVDGAELVFEVRDRGDGINSGDGDRIFEPFFTRRTQGTGLGLAVSRRLVELHGGSIQAANHPGGGALFTVRLPRR